MPEGFLPGKITQRSRRIPAPSLLPGHSKIVFSNGAIQEDVGEVVKVPAGKQFTVSEGHRWPAARTKGKWSGDSGGEFFTQKSYAEINSTFLSLSKRTYPFGPGPIFRDSSYEGHVYATNPVTRGWSYPVSTYSNNDTLDELGATAIARCKPTNSIADLATALGELLHDGLPHLPGVHTWRDRTAINRKAGSEYLNVVFGWLPLVGDVTDVSKAVKNAGQILKQYERDAGKQVRRQYHFPSEETSVDEEVQPFATPYMSPANSDIQALFSGRVIKTRKVSRSRWFSGAFTYWLPTGTDSRSRLLRHMYLADHLLGTRLDPESLWNLAPWSWAVDWFSNTGDVISNLTAWALDGLVMRYGYMMEHSIVRDTYSYENTGGSIPDSVPPISFVTETKIRRKANPFGFGIHWEDLSPFQWSILIALGLARS